MVVGKLWPCCKDEELQNVQMLQRNAPVASPNMATWQVEVNQ